MATTSGNLTREDVIQIMKDNFLTLFEQIGAVKNADQFLLMTAKEDSTIVPTKITAELVRAYLNKGFQITVGDDGYLYVGGEKTAIGTFMVEEKTQAEIDGMKPSEFLDNVLYVVPEE